jgi:hypothetical protein
MLCLYEYQMSATGRKYDKGEKRFKHVGTGDCPEFRVFSNDPKRVEGLCPRNMSAELREKLLNEAVAAPNGDRKADYPKYLYVVHNGAIYEARTSDAGVSYHGFPLKGPLSKQLVATLRTTAQKKKCVKEFDRWIKDHITLQGSNE